MIPMGANKHLTGIILGIAFVLVGILFVLFSGRFGRWAAEMNYENNTWGRGLFDPNHQLTKEEYIKKFATNWFFRSWLVLIKVMGVMLLGGGFVSLLAGLNILK